MQHKPIETYQVENAILGKDLNLSVIGSFFHVFTLVLFADMLLDLKYD
jgi:hypothetical protein